MIFYRDNGKEHGNYYIIIGYIYAYTPLVGNMGIYRMSCSLNSLKRVM